MCDCLVFTLIKNGKFMNDHKKISEISLRKTHYNEIIKKCKVFLFVENSDFIEQIFNLFGFNLYF